MGEPWGSLPLLRLTVGCSLFMFFSLFDRLALFVRSLGCLVELVRLRFAVTCGLPSRVGAVAGVMDGL